MKKTYRFRLVPHTAMPLDIGNQGESFFLLTSLELHKLTPLRQKTAVRTYETVRNLKPFPYLS